jgi:aspartate racemase
MSTSLQENRCKTNVAPTALPTPVEPLWPQRIGILGGLGPHAHIRLEELLLDAAEKFAGRKLSDQEYPAWIAVSVPQVPDRTTALLQGGASPIPAVAALLPLLQSADFVIVPCNTMHAFFMQIAEHCSLPLIDMIDATIDKVVETAGQHATVGLLASNGTLEARVYQDRIACRCPGLTILTPGQMHQSRIGDSSLQDSVVMPAIFGGTTGLVDFGPGLKGGAHRNPVHRAAIRTQLLEIITEFGRMGADAVILGCTELSLAFEEPEDSTVPIVDSLRCLAMKTISIASSRQSASEWEPISNHGEL